MQQYDIIIIGGGLVGSSVAHALSQTHYQVALIDKQPLANLYAPSLDNRGIALSHISRCILKTMGCWEQLQPFAHPIKHIHVSEQHAFGFTRLSAENVKLSELGYVLSASQLGKALCQSVQTLPNITEFRETNIQSIRYNTESKQWHITLPGQQLQTPLLLAADGAQSYLRSLQNIPTKIQNHRETALITNVTLAQDHKNIAYERFTQNGILAFLPFGTKRVKCVWTATTEFIEHIQQLPDTQFLLQLQQHIGTRLGKFLALSKRISFPIYAIEAQQLYQNQMILLGNSANALHPVAAQGFNLGLRDVATIAELLTNQQHQKPLPISDICENYATLRQSDHNKTRGATEKLTNCFNHKSFLIKKLRHTGLLACQFLSPLNHLITNYGIGYHSHLPKMARGIPCYENTI